MITSLYLMLTEKCNSTCEYCYLTSRNRISNQNILISAAGSFTEFAVANHLRMNGRPQIRFVGGEPWMEADVLVGITKRFLSSIKEGLVVVNSNGTLLKEEYLAQFEGDDRLVHVVSLDGPKEVHDLRRKLANGSGFDRAKEGIRLLQKKGLPVVPNCVLDSQTLKTLPVFMDFLKEELEIDKLSLSLRFDDTNPMGHKEKYDALKIAYELAGARSIQLGGHHRLHLGAQIPKLKCRAGIDTVLINADGTTNACQRFVGRKPSDPIWRDDFDWEGFESNQDCRGICGTEQDYVLGEKLSNLYKVSHPKYSRISDLDRLLFGVVQ